MLGLAGAYVEVARRSGVELTLPRVSARLGVRLALLSALFVAAVGVQPATSEVEYGVTTDFGNDTGVQPAPVTNHLVQLSGLTPATSYYFHVISATAAQQYVSANYFVVTTNYVTTNRIFEITNSWRYTTTNPNGVDWTSTNYTDLAWSGPAPGLLWVDVRATPNPAAASGCGACAAA